jgi:hypothetical protein
VLHWSVSYNGHNPVTRGFDVGNVKHSGICDVIVLPNAVVTENASRKPAAFAVKPTTGDSLRSNARLDIPLTWTVIQFDT